MVKLFHPIHVRHRPGSQPCQVLHMFATNSDKEGVMKARGHLLQCFPNIDFTWAGILFSVLYLSKRTMPSMKEGIFGSFFFLPDKKQFFSAT